LLEAGALRIEVDGELGAILRLAAGAQNQQCPGLMAPGRWLANQFGCGAPHRLMPNSAGVMNRS
jgi:hypothetical protein